MSSIKDVAACAGISVPTVYKVFNNNASVGKETCEKVLAAARELGYTPKGNAATSGARVIGIVIPMDITSDTFYSRYLRELSKELHHKGYRLLQVIAEGAGGDEYRDCFKLLQRSRAEGVIYFPKSVPEPLAAADELVSSGFPVLQLFKTVNDQADVLLVDDVMGAYIATRQMIRQGHKRILLLQHSPENEYFQREEGYRRAFAEAGLTPNEELLFSFPMHENIKGIIMSIFSKKRILAAMLAPTLLLYVTYIILPIFVCHRAFGNEKLVDPAADRHEYFL